MVAGDAGAERWGDQGTHAPGAPISMAFICCKQSAAVL